MKTLKAFVLFLGLSMLTATQLNAQNMGGLFGRGDLFDFGWNFEDEEDTPRGMFNPSGNGIFNQTYGSDDDGFGITNQTYGQNEETPVGSGLLIMAVAGACYAGMKRNKKQTKSKTMRKYSIIMMAFALLLGMAQCKKEPVTLNEDSNGGMRITLNVNNGPSTPSTGSGTESGANNGEKLNVYPATGAVIFTQGDKIYVGNNGKYVGTLTFDNGLFQGTINDDLCSTTDYLHFYFVGNKPTSPANLTASTTTYTVNISDQSTGLPAISYAPSTAKYSPSTTAYTAKLLNKSGLVKFVPSLSTSQPITVSGLNNEVQIDFANHTLAPTGTTGGITLFSASDSEKWAILLEQASLSDLTVSVYGYNSTIDGTTLPSAITNNMYYNTGIGIAMTEAYQTFVVTSTSPETTIASFNAAASTPTPKLYFETNYGDGLTITRANGIVDFNGHSAKVLFIQNDVEGESITLQNGTISPKPIDGSNEGGFYYKGTVILENMTVTGNYAKVFTDGHAYIINSGTYNNKICCDTYSGYPGTTTIYGGYFTELGFNSGPQGTFILYGGKYQTRPDDSWCAEGYAVKSNTDADSGTYPWVVCALPEGALKGEFTINDNGGKVYFSKGNLQYFCSTSAPEWRFAEEQYDYVVFDKTAYSENSGKWIGLFSWGSSGYDGHYPYAFGTLGNIHISGTNYDWGVYNTISNGGSPANQHWRTPTKDEWNYIFSTRNASSVNGVDDARFIKAKVNNVNCVILFPDNYIHPSGVTAPVSINADASFDANNYSLADWTAMQAAGCVCLPAQGSCTSDVVYNQGAYGHYWSSTFYGSNESYYVYFWGSYVIPVNNIHQTRGNSVRLVCDVQ